MTKGPADIDKKYQLQLKNGEIIELSSQDVISDNLYKLREKIPNLKIAEGLSEKNPLKKALITLEAGVQNKESYYQWMSFFILCYFWLIQMVAFYQHSPSAMSMLLITLWGTYAIIRLQIKPYFQGNTLYSVLKNKGTTIFGSPSILISFLVSIGLSLFLKGDNLCYKNFWSNLYNLIKLQNLTQPLFFEYIYLVSFFVVLLMSLYNIYNIYETSILQILLNFYTKGIKIFGFVVVTIALIYIPVLAGGALCKAENEKTFMGLIFSILPVFLFYAIIPNLIIIIFSIFKHIVLHFNKQA